MTSASTCKLLLAKQLYCFTRTAYSVNPVLKGKRLAADKACVRARPVFDKSCMKLSARLLRSCLARQSASFRLPLLLVALVLAVGPRWCQLLCSDGCCAQDSDCPICVFALAKAAPADEPVILVAQSHCTVLPAVLPESHPRPAEDHQLLPSRAPPLLPVLLVG